MQRHPVPGSIRCFKPSCPCDAHGQLAIPSRLGVPLVKISCLRCGCKSFLWNDTLPQEYPMLCVACLTDLQFGDGISSEPTIRDDFFVFDPASGEAAFPKL